jgi:hypothetical protein
MSLRYGARKMVAPKPKKRKLVISGIGADDVCGWEGVKNWCEVHSPPSFVCLHGADSSPQSFGQIRSMVRGLHDEIHVDFRKASVAETVCRVRARVVIKGVGHVDLSWYVGKRRG